MQFLKKNSIDPNLYMRVYQAGYDDQQRTGFGERLQALGRVSPFGRILRYWPLLGALILGIAAGIGITSRNRSPVVFQAKPMDRASPGSRPLNKTGVVSSTTGVVSSPVQTAPLVSTAVPASLRSVPVPPVTQAPEKAPAVEQHSRKLDFGALLTASKPRVSGSTAVSKLLPPPSPVGLSSVPQIPTWTALPPIKAAPPAAAPPAKFVAAPPRPAAHVDLHVSDPQPLRKVIPGKVSSGVLLYEDLDVRIKVTVGADGRVTGAQPVSSVEKIDQARAGAALVAARQWLFHPATLRGQAIPSDYIIVFRFHARQ